MFKKSIICRSLLLAFGTGAALSGASVSAQETQRVEITGSSIKRIAAEGALPVQTIKREEIERSGVTSVVELMQKMSFVQGGTTEADGIGGGGGGTAEVSIHNQGGDRTLVLLNGRRLVGEAGGAVDLNMIPLSAIERVEVLTDGAGATYGSDAVAGVVNFITRKNSALGGLELRASIPEKEGGREYNFGISKGFGDLERDRFNVLLSASYDKRESLSSNQREFSKTGIIRFSDQGKNWLFFNGSPRSIPGNVEMPDGTFRNIYKVQNGVCPPQHQDVEGDCYFDYASTVMGYPTRERMNGMVNAIYKINNDHVLKFDAYLSKTETQTRIAATPGELTISPTGPLGSYLTAVGWDPANGDATVWYRVMDLGGRQATYKRNSYGSWLSGEGRFGDWNYTATAGVQETTMDEYNKGYPLGIAFNNLMSGGLWNPFVQPGNQSAAAIAAANAVMADGRYDTERSRLYTLDFKVDREVFAMGGGNALWALGASYNEDRVSTDPSDVARGVAGPGKDDSRFGDAAAAIPYSATRKAFGIYTELVMPIAKELELNAALRYDDYQNIDSSATGKVSLKYKPISSLLLRASVGTGFRAPTLRQLYRPLQTFGVTGKPYTCSAEMAAIATSLSAICRPGNTQYDVVTGGVPSIKPEKSKQANIGFRFEPTTSFSVGADLWWLGIEDTFGSIDEPEAFGNAAKYRNLWSTYRDPVTGNVYLAYNSSTTNLGKSYASGIDIDIEGRFATPVGQLSSALRGTYMLRDTQQLLVGGTYYSTVADNNPSIGTVSFRWKATWSNTLKSGNWTHTANVNYQSGYKDFPADVYELNGAGSIVGADTVRLDVKQYTTVDWQTSYAVNKALSVTVGVKNLFGEDPPLSLRATGAHMLGYDYRYYNPLGRTYQAKLNYQF